MTRNGSVPSAMKAEGTEKTTGADVDATVQPTTDPLEVLELRHGFYAHYVLDAVARRRRLDALATARARGRRAT